MQFTRYHRPVDGGPLRAGNMPLGDRLCGIEIGGQTIAADGALEMRPATRRWIDGSALGTFAAGVSGGNGNDFDPSQRRLVSDHRLQTLFEVFSRTATSSTASQAKAYFDRVSLRVASWMAVGAILQTTVR